MDGTGRVARGLERHRARTRRAPWVIGPLLVVLGVFLAACAEEGSGTRAVGTQTAAPASGSEDVEGVSATVAAEPTAMPAPSPTPTPEVDHSFSEQVLPVLEGSCARCHAPGGPGAPHWELATAMDALVYAPSLARLTTTEAMPPWPATDRSVAFRDDTSLDAHQIEAIQRWADAGASIDVDPDHPIVPSGRLQAIEDPDLVVTSVAGPYQGSTDKRDDYRCLIFDPQISEPGWILASHFEPDQTEVVHHNIVNLASAELRGQAEWLDAGEPGPGWTCYGGNGLDTRSQGGYMFGLAGWAPGAQPSRQPDGYGIPIRPGDFLVLQIHYHYDSEDPPADLSRMVFDLASPEQIAAQPGGRYKSLESALYLGPAEIPCYEGDTHPLCDRDAAKERLQELYGPWPAGFSDAFLRRCGSTPEDYAHMTDGTASSSCDLPVVHAGRIVSVAAHMHELGWKFTMTLNPDTPEERILLDIDDWDFEWQFGYRPVEEIEIDRSDVIRVECTWNRERAPYDAVGYVLWSDGTADEMCYSSIVTAPIG